MNIAVIFAGGTGQRMNSKTRPKQFLELHNKPIIIYTIEAFEESPCIDGIVVVCLESWIDYCKSIIHKYELHKVLDVVKGGSTGQESIYNGIKRASELASEGSIVLIHDGVRPLIDQDTIARCVENVKAKGSAITVCPAIETIIQQDENNRVNNVIDRKISFIARAPQCFFLKDILDAHERARSEGRNDFIDSASIMMNYGYQIFTVEGHPENIKITTPSDYYLFRAFLDAKENSQIFGF